MARLSDAQGNRESVPLSKVPDHMQKAMLAAEDQDFYQNNGISPTGIARAVCVAVKGGQATQGGSTITQQYVKNYFLTADRTLSRKAREILISLKIDQQQSKDQILENYLNTIYYGRGAYGIQTASRAYFNKDVSKLTPAESAFLAAVIGGPSLYDPALGDKQEANAKERSGYILDAHGGEGLAEPGRARRGDLPDTFPQANKPRTQSGPDRLPHPMVKNEVVSKYKISDSDIDRGGLRIVSTIDKGQAGRHGHGGPEGAAQGGPGCPGRHGLDPGQRRHRRHLRRRGLQKRQLNSRPRTRCRPARRSRSSP